MAYQQVDTILEHTADFHGQVAAGYGRLAETCPQPRAQMLLGYLSDHERRLGHAIERFREETPSRVLGTWVTTSRETADLADHIALPATFEADEQAALDLGLQMDNHVIEVFEELAETDAPEWVTETFVNLLGVERQFERQMVQQAGRGADL